MRSSSVALTAARRARAVLACLALAALAGASPRAGAQSAADATLPNGLRVIVAPRHAVAIAAIDVWVRAGTRRQTPDQAGVAHFLEHLLFKGTPTRPTENDIDGAIEDLGGSLDGATSYDWAHFYTVVPAASFEPALAVIADALQHASITAQSVDSERSVVESEIERAGDDPAAAAAQAARLAMYGPDHPYGRSITGTTDDVASIQRGAILSFYHAFYVPSNVAVVVAGDVTPERAQQAARASFGEWKGEAAPPEQSLPGPSLDGVVRQVRSRSAAQSTIVLGWPAPSVRDQPDVWAMDVLLTYLGQGARNVLDDDLRRSRHVVDAVTADFLTQRDTGIMTVTALCATSNIEPARAGILRQIAALRETPLPAGALEGAKRELLSSYLFDTETVSGKADALGFYEMIDSHQYDEQYVQRVNSVTPAQVQSVARKYLSADSYVQLLVVPPPDPQNAAATPLGNGRVCPRLASAVARP